MTIITQDREPSKVTASKQITGTLITAIHPKQLASKRSFAWSTMCIRASILACNKQWRELNVSGYVEQFESCPLLLTAGTLQVVIISSEPPCPVLTNPLNQMPSKHSWCSSIMDDIWLSWPSMATAFHSPWLPSTSNSHQEYCTMSLQTLFRIRPHPWTTTNLVHWSIVTCKLCTDKGGWIYPQLTCDCYFFSVSSGPQKIKFK